MTENSLNLFQKGLQAYLGLIQFLFLLTWIVYVIFLEGLVVKMGMPKEFVPRLLLADQLVFVIADITLGYFSDRILGMWNRITPFFVTLNLLSCFSFVFLPHVTPGASHLFIGITIFWVITSSVLRAPLYGLIAKHSSMPGKNTSMALLGMGIASAIAPYLGQVLKNMDPVFPFMISAVSLAVAGIAFGGFESHLRSTKPPAGEGSSPCAADLFKLMALMVLFGAGMQLHVFVNAVPLYKSVADVSLLPWVLPVFWIGFSFAVNAGVLVMKLLGEKRVFALSAAAGSLCALGCIYPLNLSFLLVLQTIAGISWGLLFLSGIIIAGQMGSTGRESLFVGSWFACLAVGAIIRIGSGLAGWGFSFTATVPLAAGFWAAGALLSIPWLFSSRAS